jgi:predicted HAD superfamily Cof-like phosphohydrolase
MTNFQKVQEFNELFGAIRHNTPNKDILDNNKLIKFRMDLIREEMKELEEAVQNKDYVETVDALSDILYVVYGMGDAIGVNLDDAFKLVHESNMSKLCDTEKQAIETVEWYKEQFKLGLQPYDTPNYRSRIIGNKEYFVVYNESTSKILKSIYYQPVDLKKLCD